MATKDVGKRHVQCDPVELKGARESELMLLYPAQRTIVFDVPLVEVDGVLSE